MRLEENQSIIYYSGEKQPEIRLKDQGLALIIAHKPYSDDKNCYHLAVLHFDSVHAVNNKFLFRELDQASRLLENALNNLQGQHLNIQFITPEANLQHSQCVLKTLFKIKNIREALEHRGVLIESEVFSIKEKGMDELIEKLTYHPYSHFKIVDFNRIESIQPVEAQKSKTRISHFWRPACLTSKKKSREKSPVLSLVKHKT